MSGKTFRPCCQKFKKLAVRYCDLVSNDDHALRMLSELLLRATEDIPLDGREIRSVAHEIEQYLNRKVVREHWLFDRPLCLCTFDEVDTKTELSRIRSKLTDD